MESEWVKVTTETQFFYYLKRGEIIAFRIENSEAFVDYFDDGVYRVILNLSTTEVAGFRTSALH